MKLYLCEKPSQARDLAGVLGVHERKDGYLESRSGDVVVTWAFGHLLELFLPDEYDEKFKRWDIQTLPIVPDVWKSKVKKSSSKQYGIIKRLVSQASIVAISTDYDREGEAIARSVLERLGYKGEIERVCLTSLDEDGIKRALSSVKSNEETIPLYHAALARQRADWLVGMNMSRLYTTLARQVGYNSTLHIGRVVTPMVYLVCHRDNEVNNFKPSPFWVLKADVSVQRGHFKAVWDVPEQFSDANGRCINKTYAEQVAGQIKNAKAEIQHLEQKKGKESAPLPFHITSLQQYANRKWGYTSTQVLEAAQALYETHKATTYPRTDSRYLPESQKQYARSIFQGLIESDPDFSGIVAGADADAPARVFSDAKMGKSSHHAIIPTSKKVDLDEMSEIERNIYDAIRRYYVAQFYSLFEFQRTNVVVSCFDHTFRAQGKVPLVQGWKMVLGTDDSSDDDSEEESQQGLPPMNQGEPAVINKGEIEDKMTKAPPRYTEASLLSAMEHVARFVNEEHLKAILKETSGIGTPATRASIIEGAIQRDYLKRKGKIIQATPKAFALISVVPADIKSPGMTATWEQQLESIAEGEESMNQFMTRIESWVGSMVTSLKQAAPALTAKDGILERSFAGAIQERAKDFPLCLECKKSELKRIKGKYGFFWACRDQGCKATFDDKNGKPEPKVPAPKCPECTSLMRLRKGKKPGNQRASKFWGCSKHPECKATLPFKSSTN